MFEFIKKIFKKEEKEEDNYHIEAYHPMTGKVKIGQTNFLFQAWSDYDYFTNESNYSGVEIVDSEGNIISTEDEVERRKKEKKAREETVDLTKKMWVLKREFIKNNFDDLTKLNKVINAGLQQDERYRDLMHKYIDGEYGDRFCDECIDYHVENDEGIMTPECLSNDNKSGFESNKNGLCPYYYHHDGVKCYWNGEYYLEGMANG